MSDVAPGPTGTLAQWVSSVSADAIPPRVRERTAHLLVDGVASALAGRHGDETLLVETVAQEVAPGSEASVIGGGTLSRLGAAFLNGYQVTAVTVCDVYRPALFHVTPEVIPPALATAEGRAVTGRDLITAVAIGLETAVRIARGINYPAFRERGWHSPGVMGPFGGAAAAGRLMNLDGDRMRWALGLAGSQAAGTFAHWGTPTIKFHQARGSVSGLLAATLAREDFRASDEVLAHPDGGIFGAYSDGGDPSAVVADLGDDWELERISMRLWPAASSIQSAISAIFDLIEAHDLRPADVERLTIALSDATYRMHGEMGWDTRFKALLSTRYAAAVVLHDRECWLEQFGQDRIGDPVLDAFARDRIVVVSDPAIAVTGAAATVLTIDGRELTVRRDVPKGDAAEPLSSDEIGAKFAKAADGILPAATSDRTLQRLFEIESIDNVDEVLPLLRADR